MAAVRSLLLMLCLTLVLAGCRKDGDMDASLPRPNFDGPVIAQRTPPPAQVQPRIDVPKPRVASDVPREWVPTSSSRPWRWIVIHHSATPTGGAASFDRMHREKGWDELGYHFVIGNGTDTPDGKIEIGPRWPVQKWGAHAKTADNRFNDYGVGICLVGNFDTQRPTQAQMKSLAKLTAYLMKTYRIPPDRILGHGDTKPTECPGRNMRVAEVRRMASRAMADAGDITPGDETDATFAASASSSELLTEPTQ